MTARPVISRPAPSRGRTAGRFAAALLALTLVAAPVGAVEPDEVLADAQLEGRAREISKDLRCLVCRNESIDESNSSLARDLRLLVRERLVAGDSDEEVVDFIVERYGEYALLRPRKTGSTLLLWYAGPAMLFVALGGVAVYLHRRRPEANPTPIEGLSPEEQARLDAILRK